MDSKINYNVIYILLIIFTIYFGSSFNSNKCRSCSSRFNCNCNYSNRYNCTEHYATSTFTSNADLGYNNLTLIDENNNMGSIQFPKGIIVIWNGSATTIPNGWTFCDGTLGTPDLRGRFIISTNPQTNNNSKFIIAEPNTKSSEVNPSTFSLTSANLPSHSHPFLDSYYSESSSLFVPNPRALDGVNLPAKDNWIGSNNNNGWNGNPIGDWNTTLANTGVGSSINLIPPYYSVCYIMKL